MSSLLPRLLQIFPILTASRAEPVCQSSADCSFHQTTATTATTAKSHTTPPITSPSQNQQGGMMALRSLQPNLSPWIDPSP